MGSDTGACHTHAHEHEHFSTATAVLKAEHRVIEKALDALERLAKGGDRSSLGDWAKVIDFARNFADKCHHLKEEQLLFPAMEQHGIPREGGPIGMMLAEHEEGRGYVRAMAAALDTAAQDATGARATLQKYAAAYIRLLREHIQKEDEVLFEMADDVLDDAEQERLLRDFEEHELKEMGSDVHEKYLKIVQELA
jgi:hemerythrin-like domain-containing protein